MEILGLIDVPLWSILLTILGILSYIYSTWNFDTWRKQGVPGSRPLPVFGTFLSTIRAGGFTHYDLPAVKKYGKIFGPNASMLILLLQHPNANFICCNRSFRGRTPILAVADPEFLRLAMIKDFSSMPNKQDASFGTIIDNFMVSLTDDHWRHVRSSLSPTFTSGKLKLLKAKVDECADLFMKYLKETDGEPFDVKRMCGSYSLDTISRTAFGVQVDSHKDPNHPMRVNASIIMGSPKSNSLRDKIFLKFQRMAFLFLPAKFQRFLTKIGLGIFNAEALSYFEGISGQILSERGLDTTKQKDFVQLCLDQLIDNPDISDPASQKDRHGKVWSTKGLTKDEIIGSAIIFFLAGYETTALTLHFILYELAMNPDIQERAYQEIENNMSSEVATYDELMKMEYLDWVINETMRLYPPGPRLERLVDKETTVGGIHLPVGAMVSAMIFAVHRDPEYWPEPERFDPERFSQENKEGRHQYAWIGFGIGNRNCIGMRLALMEIKILLTKILINFVLEPCAETPNKPIEFTKNFQMFPVRPIKLTAKQRKTVSTK